MGDIVRMARQGRFIGWYVRYKDVDGKRKMRASHQPTQALARRYLLEVEARAARGLVGIPEPAPKAPSLSELVERFLVEYHRPRIKDLEQYRAAARRSLRRALLVLGALPADAVEVEDLNRLRMQLCRRAAPRTVRLTLAYLGVVYSFAVKKGIVKHNPLRGIERPTPAELIEYLSQKEVRALLAAAAERAAAGDTAERMRHACLRFGLYTGLRKGELFGLRWPDLDLEACRLTVARSYRTTPKGGRARHLRLPEAVVPLLTEWAKECPATAEQLIFPILSSKAPRMGRPKDMLGIHRLLAASGCRRLSRPWHAIRHTFASHFIMNGGNILTLQKILGHADIKMTLAYAHLAPDYLGDEMNRLKY